jgi:arylsulfatase A-like enzyme
MSTRPNVVFLFTDDQRFDTIRALGNPRIHTPNMDRLVENGTAFTRAFIPGGTSGAVCMPSRAMVHTGRTLFHIEGNGETISPDHATMGGIFRRAGYATFGTGKWHNGVASYARSFADGDEIFYGGMADHWNVPAYHFDPAGRYETVCLQVEDFYHSNRTTARRCDHIHAGCHSTDIISEAAVRFIERADPDKPFFCYAAFLAPHDPRTMPPEFLAMYDPEEMPLPDNFMGGHPFDNGELHVRDEELAGFPRTPEEIRRHISEYYAMISHLDARIGDIFEAVRRKGEMENTIFVLAGDNGLALGQHGLMGKQSLYEHSVRVPLVFRGPGIPRGTRTDSFAYLLDIFPTLCGLTGVEVPDTVDGVDLRPAMQSPGAPLRETLYLAYTDLMRGVRTDHYKLVEYARGGRHTMTQLFDLEADPLELHNLAEDPGHRETLASLRRELLRLRDEWDDPASEWGQRFWSACRLSGME